MNIQAATSEILNQIRAGLQDAANAGILVGSPEFVEISLPQADGMVIKFVVHPHMLIRQPARATVAPNASTPEAAK